MNIATDLSINVTDLRQKFNQAKILVVGDVMLDQYWFGDTTRISPEAPVPVTKIEKTEHRAGGAANVARNIASLGGQAFLLSVTGQDESAENLKQLMDKDGINYTFIEDKSISTTIKLRVIARSQQLIRLDFEAQPKHEILLQVLDKYKSLLQQVNAIILSDYGKGGLTHVSSMIDSARELKIPVLIDPKGSDYIRYKGATMITPNRAELKEVIGSWDNEEELTIKAQQLREGLRLDSILLTRSEEGLSLFKENCIENQATQAQEIYDVSGAGDTVIAGMALSLAAGLNDIQAMKVANTAAGIVVAKIGTAVCSLDELLNKKTSHY